jgi:trehalose synthase
MGKKAKETVRKHFLLTRYVEQYLDLFSSFETIYRLKSHK